MNRARPVKTLALLVAVAAQTAALALYAHAAPDAARGGCPSCSRSTYASRTTGDPPSRIEGVWRTNGSDATLAVAGSHRGEGASRFRAAWVSPLATGRDAGLAGRVTYAHEGVDPAFEVFSYVRVKSPGSPWTEWVKTTLVEDSDPRAAEFDFRHQPLTQRGPLRFHWRVTGRLASDASVVVRFEATVEGRHREP